MLCLSSHISFEKKLLCYVRPTDLKNSILRFGSQRAVVGWWPTGPSAKSLRTVSPQVPLQRLHSWNNWTMALLHLKCDSYRPAKANSNCQLGKSADNAVWLGTVVLISAICEIECCCFCKPFVRYLLVGSKNHYKHIDIYRYICSDYIIIYI